jgi:WD40 repeat protein
MLPIAVLAACLAQLSIGRLLAEERSIAEPAQVLELKKREQTDKPPVITAVAILPGGGMVATAGDDHAVRLWSTTTGRIVHALDVHQDWVRALQFSPDGRVLASAGDDRQIVLWQVSTGKLIGRMPVHPRAIYAIAYSPDGSLLAAVGFEHVVRVYDAASGALVRELEGPGIDLRTVDFSPDGKQLAAAGRNGQIRLWHLPSGTIALEIAASLGRIRTLAYLPDGRHLVSAGEGRNISIWDTSTGEQRGALECRPGKVLSMTVCGENLIATGGSDNLVRVWNWQTQTEADRLQGHTGSVATLAYDPQSATIISGSFDTTVRVWKLGASRAAANSAEATPPNSRVR